MGRHSIVGPLSRGYGILCPVIGAVRGFERLSMCNNYTVDLEIFMLGNFRMIDFCRNNPLLY